MTRGVPALCLRLPRIERNAETPSSLSDGTISRMCCGGRRDRLVAEQRWERLKASVATFEAKVGLSGP